MMGAQSVVFKLIFIVIFVYSLTILLTSNPWPFSLESIKKMEKSSGLITLIPSNKIVQLDATNENSITSDYDLEYEKLDSFALSFNIYIESSGLKSMSDVSYNIITLQTHDISLNRGNNSNFIITYDSLNKQLKLNFDDSSFNNFITNNGTITNNSYIIPITFNSNNLYKWHHILLNFTRSGIDIYSSNNNNNTYNVTIDQATDKISGTSNYGNKLIKEIKFINPPNYLNFKFKKIIIGNTNNLGNDYISLSKMFFYAREINNEELDKINNI